MTDSIRNGRITSHAVRGWRVLWVLGISLLVAPQLLFAQFYPIENIEEADGLPSPVVKSIVQDRMGCIWAATRGGLACHDGAGWRKSDIDSLVFDESDALLQVDDSGEVWALFSGFSPALLRLVDGSWGKVPLPPQFSSGSHAFQRFCLGRDGARVIPIILEQPAGVHIQGVGGWRSLDLAGMGISTLNDMIADGEDVYLLAPEGLYTMLAGAPGAPERLPLPSLPGPALCLTQGREPDTLWLVGANWIGLYDGARIEILHRDPEALFGAFVEARRHLCRADAYGGLYLAGGTITQYFHPALGLEDLGPRNGLLDDAVSSLYRDRENVMWLTSQQGITKILDRQIRSYTEAQGLLADEVTALLEKRDGTFVIGHPSGLTLWDDQMRPLPFTDPDLRDRVLDLTEDEEGNVWIAGRNRGLGRLDPQGRLRWWSPTAENPNYVVSVMVGLQGRVWVAASDRLLVLEGDALRRHPLPTAFGNVSYLRRLIMGTDQTVYLATSKRGVLAFQGDGTHSWDTGMRDQGNSVYDVLEMGDGRLWAATRGGLYRMQGRRLIRPDDPGYQVTRPVYCLERDMRDRLWLGTDNGVLRIEPGQTRHFTVENGLVGRETNRCASLVDERGRIWVGTERGLNIFDPRFEGPPPLPPLVSLARVEAGDFSHILDDGQDLIECPRTAEDLVFHFRAITTTEGRRLRVRARLEGVDEDWVQLENPGNRIRYANMGPGRYRFHLQAAGFGQPWSEVVSSPWIALPTPLLQSRWITVSAVLVALALVVLPIIVLVQRRYTSRLQEEVAVQVEAIRRIEQELEQTRNLRSLGVLAGGIAHDFNNLLTVIFGNISLLERTTGLSPAQLKNLHAVTGAIERARGLTQQLLTFARGGAPILQVGSLETLIRECVEFFTTGSNLKCHIDLPGDLAPVAMDPVQMSQVFGNLLRNAQEAMPAGGEVRISGHNLARGPEGMPPGPYVGIHVADQGGGIPPEIQNRIFEPYFTTKEKGTGLGLATAYSILDRHGGRLGVISEPGRGAVLQVLLPAEVATAADEPDPPVSRPSLPEGCILILDDEPEVREILIQMVRKLGLEAEGAADGETALAMYRRRLEADQPYLAIFMDLTLPGSAGAAGFIVPLRKMHPEVRAVVISGFSQDPVMIHPERKGFLAAIPKPPRPEELEAVLRRILAPRVP